MKKISDILWEAANERLHSGLSTEEYWGKDRESCCAVACAEFGEEVREVRAWQTVCQRSRALKFLSELGCKTRSPLQFNEFSSGEEQQGARYLWLMFAYLVALDEGL